MHIYARQGDLVIEKLSTPISAELTEHQGLVLAGRDTSPHRIAGKVLAAQDGRTWLVRVAAPAQVGHSDRHNAVALEPGDYRIKPLRERGDSGDRAVED
jgi:hypothetical protein